MINVTYLINIEKEFHYAENQKWIDENWSFSFVVAGLYVTTIFGLKNYMTSRPRMELRSMLLLWNVVLAAFSIVGACRMFPDLFNIYWENGFHYAVCNPRFLYETKLCFWIGAFLVSKIVEFGDTVFIVLRKQPLTFLHWYHHLTVFLYTTYGTVNHVVAGMWFAAINLLVHSFMYTYYALKILKVPVPRQVSMFITIFQILQMIIGVSLNLYTFKTLFTGEQCLTNIKYMRVSMPIYFSYFLLFLYYFRNAYLKNRTGKPQPITKKVD